MATTKSLGEEIYCYNANQYHDWPPLKALVKRFLKDGTQAMMVAKEDKFDELFKITSEAISDYDNKTFEMIMQLAESEQVQFSFIQLQGKM